MKLRNKKTRKIIIFAGTEIHDGRVFFRLEDEKGTFKREINSLAELNAEWEDAPEEPKEYWYIEADGSIIQNHKPTYINHLLDGLKSMGDYFETREEAEKAVEKLKAWKRLKDKGFRFNDFYRINDCATIIRATFDESWSEIYDDLNICFGGEK